MPESERDADTQEQLPGPQIILLCLDNCARQEQADSVSQHVGVIIWQRERALGFLEGKGGPVQRGAWITLSMPYSEF